MSVSFIAPMFMFKVQSFGLLLAFALVPPAPPAAGQEGWPQFRGPTGDGVALKGAPPIRWSETNHIAWKVRVTGRGRSSPVLLGERLWLTTVVEQGVRRTRIGADDMQTAERVSLRALCLDGATGRSVWEVVLFEVDKPAPVHWLNSWATPTPVVEAGRVYCDFGTFGTACLEAETGKVLWKQRLPLDHQVGPGSSPLLVSNLLVLVRDGRDQQYVTGLDKQTGETIWKTSRPPIRTSSPDLRKSFSSPLLIEANGRAQIVSSGAHWVASYDPASGRELWRVRHGDGFSIGSCPVFGQGMVIFSTGCFRPQLYAIRPDGEGDVTDTHVAWKNLRQVPVMSSPTLAGDEIYWVSDDGMACCAEAHTGRVCWQERLGGLHLASPVSAQGRIYFFSQDGKTTVIKAGRQFEELAVNALDGTVIATPAFVGQAIYLRTDSHLYRIEERSGNLSEKARRASVNTASILHSPSSILAATDAPAEMEFGAPGRSSIPVATASPSRGPSLPPSSFIRLEAAPPPPTPVETTAGWRKFEGNPVMGGQYGTCFDISVLKEDATYRMWLSWRPKASLALVESKDGVHWSEPPRIVLGPKKETGWEDDINRPVVLKRSGTYHLWYSGFSKKGSSIGYATSPDGVTWKRMSDQPVLTPERPWEKNCLMCPHVLWDEEASLYKMWYSGGERNEPDAIGYATSPDGLKWTKYTANPVFTPERMNDWEKHKVTACQVEKRDDWYVMFYIGFRDEPTAQIGLARSKDGLTDWQRHPANPIIRTGGPKQWDHDACYKPYAICDGRRWLLWYNGRRGSLEQIGVVFHDGEDLGFR
jgi:outer membrane protein assembly factor BamB